MLSIGKAVDIFLMGRHKCEFEEKYLIFFFLLLIKGRKNIFDKIKSRDSQRLILSLLSLCNFVSMVRDAGLHFWVPRAGIFLEGISHFVSGGNPYQETSTSKAHF